MRVILRGKRSTWRRCWMTSVAPRIVNDVSCATRINDACHFTWQAQYLVTWCKTPVAPHIVNDVSYVTDITHESHFAWQAQHVVTLVTVVLRALQMRAL